MKLIIASHNLHKIEEIKPELSEKIELVSLQNLGYLKEIPENSDTLEGNALEKAKFIYDLYKLNTIADDTGLEVKALDNAPGVYSARYAGNQKDSLANIHKLLNELKGVQNRKARFRTVITLIINDKISVFEGIVNGIIINQQKGKGGFGYDPIFQPEGFSKTFAEMSLEEKNLTSHRAMAIRKLSEYLNNIHE
ncbi:MAG: RdgB/HAM1 family non-canonical purine NTP pyrophosphatase [Bacteroidota bacterium]|nr:RdgB/HAM1 family non-canonical purine NTP pyrophosphatase [Bacteroidota bacterium]